MRISTVLVLAMASGAAAASLADGGDWPQWRGPARDGRIPDLKPRAAWPAALKTGWTVKVGVGHASPVVVGNRAFVFSREGENEVLRALDLSTGREVWRQSYPAPYTLNPAAASHGKGPKATPTYADGRLFTFGISGILSAWDAASGRSVWRKQFGQHREQAPTYGAAMSPLVDRGLLIVHVGGENDGALDALDAATGAVRWTWKGDGPGYASPVTGDLAGVRQVVTQSQKLLIGLSADRGQLLWSVPFTTSYDQNAVTPILQGDVVVYGGLDQPMRALRVVRRGSGYATEPVWENADVASYLSSPVLAEGSIYGLSQRKKGQYYRLDARSGKTLWLSEGRQGDNAAILAGGGTLFLLDTDGELSVAALGGSVYAPLRTWTVASTPTWAQPAITDAGILVKDAETLTLWRFE
jgi:outer membrane protein assembly factor BamB